MEHHEAVRTMAAERYLLDEMTGSERDAFEAHYFECATCADVVRTGAALADGVRDGAAAAPAAVPAPSRRLMWFAPLGAAAALALVASYQAFVTIPGLRSQLAAPQALLPVAVAPASRGEGTVIPVSRTGGALVLALDVNMDPPPTEQLVYDLRTDAGVAVLSGYAPVPPQGTPLLLLLPGNSLNAGQYAIVVRDSADPNREGGTYRFIVR